MRMTNISSDILCQLLESGPVWGGVFKYDVLRRRPTTLKSPFPLRMTYGSQSDGDVMTIRNSLNHEGVDASVADIRLALQWVTEQPSARYNPVIEYLDTLPKPVGPLALDTIHETILNSPDGPISSSIFKKQLVAAVRRVRAMPGLHEDLRPVDHRVVVVLDGPQECGKTSLLRLLGGPWYGSLKGDLRDADTRLTAQGKLIVEMEEMVTAKKSDRDLLKAFISDHFDEIRAPYARSSERVQRSYVLFGTSNELRFEDPTGHARFAPISVGKMNQANAESLKDQLWAEANALALSPFSHYLDDEEKAFAASRCSGHEIADTLAETLQEALAGVKFLTLKEAYRLIYELEAEKIPSRADELRFVESLRRIGCSKKIGRVGELTRKGWLPPTELVARPMCKQTQLWLSGTGHDPVASQIRAKI